MKIEKKKYYVLCLYLISLADMSFYCGGCRTLCNDDMKMRGVNVCSIACKTAVGRLFEKKVEEPCSNNLWVCKYKCRNLNEGQRLCCGMCGVKHDELCVKKRCVNERNDKSTLYCSLKCKREDYFSM